MFTGIIEEIGRVETLQRQGSAATLAISAKTVLQDISVDDSVSVSGVCLTATSVSSTSFTVDAVEETLRKTSIGGLGSGSIVNLERSLRFSDRLGGHIVQGHVDSVGTVLALRSQSAGAMLSLRLPAEKMHYIISEGSITVDGVSLTVARKQGVEITIALIPHTLEKTTLGRLRSGDKVNIEVDIIGKYVENMLKLERKDIPASPFELFGRD